MARDRTNHTRESDQHASDALPAYALGALDADERDAIEAHLAGCASCRAELARQEEVVGSLGFAPTPVPLRPELRAALLAEIHQDEAAPETPRRLPLARLTLAAAALAAIVSIVVLAVLLSRAMDERDDAQWGEERMAAYLADGGTLSPLLPAPDAPAGVEAGNGSLAIAPSDDKAMLVVYDLPPSSADLHYTAWAERDGDRIQLGEVEVNDRGVGWLVFYPQEPMSDYDFVGINRVTPDTDETEPFLVATVNS